MTGTKRPVKEGKNHDARCPNRETRRLLYAQVSSTFTVPSPPLHIYWKFVHHTWPVAPMIPSNPLQQLCDLDGASPQFHEQLSNFFRGSVYRNVLPSPQSESLTWLVEYLDSVRLEITLLHAALTIDVGSCPCFRPQRPGIPGTLERTSKDMRRQCGATEIVHAPGITPGVRVRRDFQRFKGPRETCEDIPRGRPTEGQGGAHLILHFPVFKISHIR